MANTEHRKLPGEWAAEGEPYDCTLEIGQLAPLDRKPLWPMYSFDRPASILWNSIAAALHKRGWSDAKIKAWLQSKRPRWALDDELGTRLERLGRSFARTINDSDVPDSWIEE